MGPEGVRSEGHPNIFPNRGSRSAARRCACACRAGLRILTLVVHHQARARRRRRSAKLSVWRMNHVFGPAGLLEQDDGENWGSESTRSAHGVASRKLEQNLQMGLGHDEAKVGAGGEHYVEGLIGEHGQRGSSRLDGTGWSPRIGRASANHTRPPVGVVLYGDNAGSPARAILGDTQASPSARCCNTRSSNSST